MGGGTFTRHAWAEYSATTSSLNREQAFAQRRIHSDFDPKNISLRESRDSIEHPVSNAIILGLDVTGSMGMIADHIAKVGLGELVLGLLETNPVSDPQIAIAGIGDSYCDKAPFQVTQFESDIRIGQQLRNLWLEGGGGGNHFESYDLAWYFAANHTVTDCFEKRGKKGYLFTFGDEMVPSAPTPEHIRSIFGTSPQSTLTTEQLYADASEKWNVFHIMVEQGNYARTNKEKVATAWRNLMGYHAIRLSNYEQLSQVVLATIRVAEGEDPDQVIASEQIPAVRETVRHAIKD
jgi:hypothetical protein